MDAASISMMKLESIQNSWALGMAKNIKEVAEQRGQAMVEMIEQSTAMLERSVNPHIGGNIDIRL
ncbi:putative motility protein [Clostridiales bacterium COT073_COT-073]|nr:putative motility protein [Clostridiales bacterium COT073_COT-073]